MAQDNRRRQAAKRGAGRPTQQDAADRERQLLAIAMREFLQHGYGGASMSQIIQTAGVSKTTLYSRFSSKEALFRAIVEQQIGEMAPETILETGSERA